MSLADAVMGRVVEPAVIGWHSWRGDPLARWMRPAAKADPYPLYAAVRERGLARSRLGPWVTAGHATASAVLRDRRFSSAPSHQRGYSPPEYEPGDPRAGLPQDLLTLDPPDHTRIRRLVSGAFTPKVVAALEPFVRAEAARLLDAAGPGGFDLIGALAFPLPMTVICRLLGVPAEDQAAFRAWGRQVAATLEPRTARAARGEPFTAQLALTAYLRDLVARRRADPDGSLLSALIAAEEDGERLTPAELVATALLVLVAGFETTVNLVGNGTVALLSEPGREQWRALAGDPALAPGAVEELLRYDSPVQLTSRTATEDADVGGTLIPAGTQVITAIGGANRDPDAFADPDRLDITRPDAARHLSFSLGIHHCLGAALARLEGRVALQELAGRHPGLELAAPPVRRPLLVLRGYQSVPVRAGGITGFSGCGFAGQAQVPAAHVPARGGTPA
jgi:cytochrome P450